MKIAIASDHAGFKQKQQLINYLESAGYAVQDLGPDSADRVDYPDYGHQLASTVLNESEVTGIALCGSGNGINMSLNKHKGIRAALAWNAEIAALGRQHNNANVLALPARFVGEQEARDIVKAFLEAKFEGGRHEKRVQKIDL